MKTHFEMFSAYTRWANARLYDAAGELPKEDWQRDVGAFFTSLSGTLNHILVADRIWMKRFTGTGEAPTALDTVLFEDFEALREAREAEDARIGTWLSGMDEGALAGTFTYTTVTDRREVTQKLSPALAHLFNHQTHHRGQAHGILSQLGHTPPLARPDLFPAPGAALARLMAFALLRTARAISYSFCRVSGRQISAACAAARRRRL